jgi:GNAT superfamily N-acetyltransferase
MRVERCESPESFLAVSVEHRAHDPIRTNVIGSVATAAATEGRYTSECFWWVVHDDVGDVVGVAIRTTPWVLSIGPMPPPAARALASQVAVADPGLPGVAGFIEPVAAFLDTYASIGGDAGSKSIVSTQRQLLYEIERVSVPDVEGELVVAVPDELDAVEAWFTAFVNEAQSVRVVRSEEDRRAFATTVREGRVRWWTLDGVHVSMAGHAVPVDTPSGVVVRVGPVYTPPERRRHGYGGAVTGALSEVLLAHGSSVMLYTDAANPTSNKIYRALGYELVDEFVHHSFVGHASHH